MKSRENNYGGYEEISGQLFSAIKESAIRRKHSFNISIEDMWNQFIKQNKKCNLTGLDLVFNRTAKDARLRTASLDRIDNKIGYEKNNIQWVHKDINMMKHSHSINEFIALCKMVANYNK